MNIPEKDRQLPPGPALYVAATPLGNMEDITLRVLRILEQADLILSEDTRKTGILLKEYDIGTRQKSYRVHMLEPDTAFAISELREKKNLVLCTDAGTPGISDPGSFLISRVRAELPDVPIFPLPGPAAISGALSICGWKTNPLVYLGFLSPKSGRRKRALEEYLEFEGIIVLYESVHRIEALLTEIGRIFPGRDIFVAREMTKLYEEYVVLNSDDTTNIEGKLKKKGEFTLIIGPWNKKESQKKPSG